MGDGRFDVLFDGGLVAGFARAAVADNLAKLFKATPETVQKLMGGGTHALKRGTDRETALKYEAAMNRAGAKAILREAPGETTAPAAAPAAEPARSAPPAAAAPSAAQPAPSSVATASPSAPSTTLSLAPQGGDILAEHERRNVEPVVVDTKHIKLVSTFMAPPEPERAPPPPVRTCSRIAWRKNPRPCRTPARSAWRHPARGWPTRRHRWSSNCPISARSAWRRPAARWTNSSPSGHRWTRTPVR